MQSVSLENMATAATELGECVACGRTQLLQITETGVAKAFRQNGACACGSGDFGRLSVDEAFSKLSS